MGKSYKKNNIMKVIRKGQKKLANKKVKNYKYEIKNGSHFKKISETYDICDQKNRFTLEGFLDYRKKYFKKENIEDEIKIWKKCYYSK